MEKNQETRAKLSLLASMAIFGTIGIFRRYIDLPSTVIALGRGAIGFVFLLLLVLLLKNGVSKPAIKNNFKYLCLSGAFIGFNWIFLFEAYRYTSVAAATLSYYMAPVFVILASPFLFKERLTPLKAACAAAAFLGMVLVSGLWQTGLGGASSLKGIAFGLIAAVFYACVILLNKMIHDIDAYDKTLTQLGAATIVLLPYTWLMGDLSGLQFTTLTVVLLLIVGIVHTGICYALYFGSMSYLKAQTIALFSYLDPIVAVILSAVILGENIGLAGYLGAVLILGAACVSELKGDS